MSGRARRANPRASTQAAGWWMLSPMIVLLGLLTVTPLLLLVWLAFNEVTWQEGLPVFTSVGLSNLAAGFHDNLFRAAIWNTTVFAFAAVALQLVLGFAMALLVTGITRGQTLYRAALLLPILMPGIVVGGIWKLMLNYDFGLLNALLAPFGIMPQDWLGSQATALAAVIVVDVWHWTPFCFLILLTGLQSIPDETREAAIMDGAGAWQRFRFITLPMMVPILTVTFVFRMIHAYKVFDEVFLLTGGGPGTATEVLSFTIYRRFFIEDRAGYGAALSVMTIIFIGVLIVVLNGVVNRLAREYRT